jgi:hypothetical protein
VTVSTPDRSVRVVEIVNRPPGGAKVKFSNARQHFVYNFLSVWTLGGREGRRPLPETVFVRSRRRPLGGAASLVLKKIQKFFSRQPLKPGSLRSGEFIEGMDLYKMASRQSPRVLTFTARGRQIFEEVRNFGRPSTFCL